MATGVDKPSEGQKAEALWAMKATWDTVRNTMIQLAEQTFFGKNKDTLQRSKCAALEKSLKRSLELTSGSKLLVPAVA